VTAVSILPHNRTPLEAAVEGVSASRFPLPTHLIAAVWDPETCPVDLLAYLAWGLSVDIWDENWSETSKREVCRKALILHRMKTTPAGIKAHVALTGATVLKVSRPPMREFRRGVMTDQERADWLNTLPQIRIYPFFQRSIAKSRFFYSGPGVTKQWRGVAEPEVALDFTDDDGTPLGGGAGDSDSATPLAPRRHFHRKSRGFNLYHRRATFYDRGAEIAVTLGSTDTNFTERVLLTRKAPWRLFYGRGFRKGYIRASVAETNVITLALDDAHQSFAVRPGMEPVNVRPQRIAQGRIAPAKLSFFGRHGGFLKSSHAPLMIYDRVALLDPSRLGARRKVRSFHGHGRYGIDPYTAELRVRVPMVRPRRRSGRWHGNGYLAAAPMAPLSKAIEAVRVSKAFRDTVMLDTATFGQVKFSGGLHFGEFVFGQIREVQ
jgi:hypothetical protein